ncbi:MAG: D-aminoacyl-tRNA deacylase [Candidatus Diapherotrites archaeon]
MKYALIVSKTDKAGMNIYEKLLNEYKFKETNKEFDSNKVFEKKIKENEFNLFLINEKQIFADYVNKVPCDVIIFLSKHASKVGTPSLTVHAPGNWGKAEFGGKDFCLTPTYGSLIKSYYLDLLKRKEEFSLNEFEVSLEVSHHGPFLEKPNVFIELGSNEKGWNNESGAKAIIECVLNSSKINEKQKAVIGLGGGHYAPSFNRLLEKSDYCTTHICPLYALPNLNKELLQQAIDKSKESIEFIALDWKGLKKEKQRIIDLMDEMDLVWKKSNELYSEKN